MGKEVRFSRVVGVFLVLIVFDVFVLMIDFWELGFTLFSCRVAFGGWIDRFGVYLAYRVCMFF